jgi:hypothetical protein
VWQELRTELIEKGVEIVTVALDAGGIDAAKPFVDMAAPEHPSLVDASHLCDEMLGVVNVPMAVWVDETGTLVRPPHFSSVQASPLRDRPIPEGLPDRIHQTLVEVKKFPDTATEYLAALRDWAERGSDSAFALDPGEVVARSQPRRREHSEATAAFELAKHLWEAGRREAAARWFRRAQELHPHNWVYKRQAWTLATTKEGELSDLIQAPNELYDTGWLEEVQRLGAENYYPASE